MISFNWLCRFFFGLAALFFLMWVTSTIARASTPAAQTDVEAIREAAARFVATQVAPGVDVEVSTLDSRLRMPACDAPLDTRLHSGSNGAQRTVEVSCAAPQSWRLYVPVRIVDVQPRLVFTRAMRAGEPISPADLRLEQRDAARTGSGPTDVEQVVGLVLRRPASNGQVLTTDLLGNAPSIQRGQIVTLIGGNGAFQVRATGKALGSAAPGELVSVENLTSRRVVQGTVLEDGRVQVAL